jgi:hypothetical protein
MFYGAISCFDPAINLISASPKWILPTTQVSGDQLAYDPIRSQLFSQSKEHHAQQIFLRSEVLFSTDFHRRGLLKRIRAIAG